MKKNMDANHQAAIFMLDIDDFKKYNDCYGHPQGDECLRQIANVFENALYEFSGKAMRYGGEEFIAVIFRIERSSALDLGRHICSMIENEAIVKEPDGVVTVSIGVCHTCQVGDASFYACIQKADQALYQAKKEEKNRVVFLDFPSKNTLPSSPDSDIPAEPDSGSVQ